MCLRWISARVALALVGVIAFIACAVAQTTSLNNSWITITAMNQNDCVRYATKALKDNNFGELRELNATLVANQDDYMVIVRCAPGIWADIGAVFIVVLGPDLDTDTRHLEAIKGTFNSDVAAADARINGGKPVTYSYCNAGGQVSFAPYFTYDAVGYQLQDDMSKSAIAGKIYRENGNSWEDLGVSTTSPNPSVLSFIMRRNSCSAGQIPCRCVRR